MVLQGIVRRAAVGAAGLVASLALVAGAAPAWAGAPGALGPSLTRVPDHVVVVAGDEWSSARVSFWCTAASDVSVVQELRDASGRLVSAWSGGYSTCGGNEQSAHVPTMVDGDPLPDGAYTFRVLATDTAGRSASFEIPVFMQLTPPGFLVAPLADDELAGIARFTYVPAPQAPPTTRVAATVAGEPVTFSGPGADGLWRGSRPTAGLPAGSQQVGWTAWWRDPWGDEHPYTELGLPVWVDPAGAAPAPSAAKATVYRFWSPRFGNAHFFTMSAAEAQHIRTSDRNWVDEGTAFAGYPADAGRCGPGTEAVHRFWSPVFTSHFFTASADEAAGIVAGDSNWTYEGVAYCAATSQVAGAVPLYRFWSPVFGKHFFTSSEAEAHQLDVNDPSWDAEGIAYFVQPAG